VTFRSQESHTGARTHSLFSQSTYVALPVRFPGDPNSIPSVVKKKKNSIPSQDLGGGPVTANSFSSWARAGRSQWQDGYFDGAQQGKTGNGDLERRGGAKYRMREWTRRIVKCVGLMGEGETARLQFWTRNKRRGRLPAWTQSIGQVVVAGPFPCNGRRRSMAWNVQSQRILLRTKGTSSPPIFPPY
jgi:hypothetical protein